MPEIQEEIRGYMDRVDDLVDIIEALNDAADIDSNAYAQVQNDWKALMSGDKISTDVNAWKDVADRFYARLQEKIINTKNVNALRSVVENISEEKTNDYLQIFFFFSKEVKSLHDSYQLLKLIRDDTPEFKFEGRGDISLIEQETQKAIAAVELTPEQIQKHRKDNKNLMFLYDRIRKYNKTPKPSTEKTVPSKNIKDDPRYKMGVLLNIQGIDSSLETLPYDKAIGRLKFLFLSHIENHDNSQDYETLKKANEELAEQFKAVCEKHKEKKSEEKADENEPKDEAKSENEPKSETNSETSVPTNVEGDGNEEPQDENLDWIEDMRRFWQEYAARQSMSPSFENPDKEAKEPFYCALSKDEKVQGQVTYTSPNDVHITKDSSLVMYQGIVEKAILNNSPLQFGKTLDDAQRLTLYAAALSTSVDGKKIKVLNPPALTKELFDTKAFTQLDANVQKILKDEFDRREKEALEKAKREEALKRLPEIDQRIEQIHKEIEAKTAESETISKDVLKLKKEELNLVKEKLSIDAQYNLISKGENRTTLREQQLGLMKETIDPSDTKKDLVHIEFEKDGKKVSINQENAERIVAARMGIIKDVKDSKDNEIKEDKAYADRKQKQSPNYIEYLKNRYASKEK